MKRSILWYMIFVTIICLGLGIYYFRTGQKMSAPEYTKEIVVQNTKFNNMLNEIFDQAETYNGSKESKERLDKLIENALEIIYYLKGLGSSISQEYASHYKQMIGAYEMYEEALHLYKESIPMSLSDKRNDNIKLAEKKFEEAKNAIQSIK